MKFIEDEPNIPPAPLTEVFYDLQGRACGKEYAAAKDVSGSYYIKVGKGGRFPDPCSMYFNEGDLNKIDKLTAQPMFSFKRVSKNVFNTYIVYLQSKTGALLRQAEREYINGK